MDEWVTAISNFGFPIVITGYLLLRLEAKMDKLTEAVNALTQATIKNQVKVT